MRYELKRRANRATATAIALVAIAILAVPGLSHAQCGGWPPNPTGSDVYSIEFPRAGVAATTGFVDLRNLDASVTASFTLTVSGMCRREPITCIPGATEFIPCTTVVCTNSIPPGWTMSFPIGLDAAAPTNVTVAFTSPGSTRPVVVDFAFSQTPTHRESAIRNSCR